MKKVLAIVLAAVMVAGMCVACGSSSKTTTAAETTVAETAAPQTTMEPASGEEAPAGEVPEGEVPEGDVPAGEVPASGTVANSAHGQQTADEAGYKIYLKEWLAAENAANDTMTDDQVKEFEALIDAGNYTDFPCDMLFSGMLTTGAAMTLEEFIAAGGKY